MADASTSAAIGAAAAAAAALPVCPLGVVRDASSSSTSSPQAANVVLFATQQECDFYQLVFVYYAEKLNVAISANNLQRMADRGVFAPNYFQENPAAIMDPDVVKVFRSILAMEKQREDDLFRRKLEDLIRDPSTRAKVENLPRVFFTKPEYRSEFQKNLSAILNNPVIEATVLKEFPLVGLSSGTGDALEEQVRASADKSLDKIQRYIAAVPESTWKPKTPAGAVLKFGTCFRAHIVREELFVRSCYDPLWTTIMDYAKTQSICICGDPGIGKSSFALYVFARLIRKPAEGEKPKCIVFFLESGSALMYRDGKLSKEIPSMDVCLHDQTWVLLDGKADVRFMEKRNHVILFASPRRENHHGFMKATEGMMLYMPPWSEDEVNALTSNLETSSLGFPALTNDDIKSEALQRFHLIGGRVRFLLHRSMNTESLRRQLNSAIANMSVDELRSVHTLVIRDHIPSICYSIRPCADFKSYDVSFCSHEAADLALRIITIRQKDAAESLYYFLRDAGVGGGLAGEIFEVIILERMMTGVEFPIKRLDDPRDKVTRKSQKNGTQAALSIDVKIRVDSSQWKSYSKFKLLGKKTPSPAPPATPSSAQSSVAQPQASSNESTLGVYLHSNEMIRFKEVSEIKTKTATLLAPRPRNFSNIDFLVIPEKKTAPVQDPTSSSTASDATSSTYGFMGSVTVSPGHSFLQKKMDQLLRQVNTTHEKMPFLYFVPSDVFNKWKPYQIPSDVDIVNNPDFKEFTEVKSPEPTPGNADSAEEPDSKNTPNKRRRQKENVDNLCRHMMEIKYPQYVVSVDLSINALKQFVDVMRQKRRPMDMTVPDEDASEPGP